MASVLGRTVFLGIGYNSVASPDEIRALISPVDFDPHGRIAREYAYTGRFSL